MISGVPQGTILGPLCFLLYINDLPKKVESSIKLFADDCKVYRSIKTKDDCYALQHDLNRLSAWTQDWLLQFSVEKCSVLRVRSSINFPYCINGQPLTEVQEQKDLGVIVSNDLKPSKHISSTVKKANSRLGMIRRCFSNRSPEVISNLYTTLIRPVLEYCSPAWSPWTKTDISEIDRVQRRCEKLCNKHIEFQSLTERRTKYDLRETYKIINEAYVMDSNKFFNRNVNNLRGHSQKLNVSRSRTDIRKHFFSNRVIQQWNTLPDKIITAPNIDSFKEELEPYLL